MSAPPEPTPSRRHLYLGILALSGFVTSFGAHVVAVNLPDYAEKVGLGALMIGLLIAVYDFAELFAKPAAGFLADRRGMRITLLGGLAVFVLGSLLFLVVPPKLLLVVRFVQGLGAAALSTVSIALVGRYYVEGRGRAFGIYNAIKGAGYVLAPTAGQTHRRTVAELEVALQAALTANDFRDPEVTGADSLLEAREWWTESDGVAKDSADALSVAHIVFGHTPDALGPRGAIATGENGLLFRIDVGMERAPDRCHRILAGLPGSALVSSKIPDLQDWVTQWVRTASPWIRTWRSASSERKEALVWSDAYDGDPAIETDAAEVVELKLRGRPDAPFWKDWMIRLVDAFCQAHPGCRLRSFTSVAT